MGHTTRPVPGEAAARNLPPTFVVRNTALISMDPNLPQQVRGAAVLVVNGVIQAVAQTEEDVSAAWSANFTIDAGGRSLVPGFTDGHAHLDRETLGDDLPGFSDATSYTDVLDVIAEAVSRAAPGEWIVTRPLGTAPGYDNADHPFGEGRLPTRDDLDTVSPHNPVFIRPIWGYWNMGAQKYSFANSCALEAAGITDETQSPHEDLVIGRDAAGVATGRFTETTWHPIVEHTLMRVAPGFSKEQRAAAISRAFERYAAFGTTAVFEGHGVADEVLDAYDTALRAGGPALHGTFPLSPYWPGTSDIVDSLRQWDSRFASHGPTGVDGIFIEGVDDIRPYALRAANYPRTGWAGFTSAAFIPNEDVEAVLLHCAENGIRVSGTARNLMPIMAAVHKKAPINKLRWTLGHHPTFTDDQIEIAAELGLALTTITGHHIVNGVFTRQLVGTEREGEIVPIRSLMDAGVPVVLGSDNQPVSIWHSIQHVVTRKDGSGRVVAPEQAVSVHDALKLVTTNGAVLTRDEGRRGLISPGFAADFAILDRNPLEIDPEQLAGTRSVFTVVGGRVVSSDGTLLN